MHGANIMYKLIRDPPISINDYKFYIIDFGLSRLTLPNGDVIMDDPDPDPNPLLDWDETFNPGLDLLTLCLSALDIYIIEA